MYNFRSICVVLCCQFVPKFHKNQKKNYQIFNFAKSLVENENLLWLSSNFKRFRKLFYKQKTEACRM